MSRIISQLYKIKKRFNRGSDIKNGVVFGRGETSKCRSRLAKYCEGYGLDLGFGGDPITLSAIRMDMVQPYTNVGNFSVQLGGKAENLHWFKDEVLDYVFSSHLLEDFFDTEAVLREWIRVLKRGGRLVIFCPDEQRFRKHCKETGQAYNTAHVHEFFSLEYVKNVLKKIDKTKTIYEHDNTDIYSWDLVCERI
jgi:predicted SAM-dependent methyltransferase